MNDFSKTDWERFDKMAEAEILANALSDRDNQPDSFGKRVHLRKSDGETLLERLRKALERERKVALTVRYDADIVRYYKAKGKGYQSVMNAALRACMEAEIAAKDTASFS